VRSRLSVAAGVSRLLGVIAAYHSAFKPSLGAIGMSGRGAIKRRALTIYGAAIAYLSACRGCIAIASATTRWLCFCSRICSSSTRPCRLLPRYLSFSLFACLSGTFLRGGAAKKHHHQHHIAAWRRWRKWRHRGITQQRPLAWLNGKRRATEMDAGAASYPAAWAENEKKRTATRMQETRGGRRR